MASNHFVSSSYWGKYFQYIDSFDKFFYRSYLLLFFLIIFVIVHASVYNSKLPEECTCHFSFGGAADGNCSKGTLIGIYVGLVFGITVFLVIIANVISICKSQFNVPYREMWLSPVYEEFTITYFTNYILLLPSLVDSFVIYVFNSLFLYNYKCKSNNSNDGDIVTTASSSSTTATTITDIDPTSENCDYKLNTIGITIFFIVYMLIYIAVGSGRFFKKPYMNGDDNGLIGSDSDGSVLMREEDYCCKLWYCNPRDRRTFVPKRFGIGLTLNMGRVSSLVFLAILFTFAIFIIGFVESLTVL